MNSKNFWFELLCLAHELHPYDFHDKEEVCMWLVRVARIGLISKDEYDYLKYRDNSYLMAAIEHTKPLFFPNTRVVVFNSSKWRSAKETAGINFFEPATVVSWYGYIYTPPPTCDYADRWTYPSCIDVIFDSEPDKVSRAHFTWGVKVIENVLSLT